MFLFDIFIPHVKKYNALYLFNVIGEFNQNYVKNIFYNQETSHEITSL